MCYLLCVCVYVIVAAVADIVTHKAISMSLFTYPFLFDYTLSAFILLQFYDLMQNGEHTIFKHFS